MGVQPTYLGDTILQKSFKVGPAAGLTPFRAVILDPVTTVPVGDDWLPPVKYPNHSFTALETLLGVIIDPVSETSGALNVVAQNKFVTVRTHGVVPVMCDDTMATPILVNDYVKSSNSAAGTQGMVAKAARTGNVIDTAQHILGVSWNKVTVNNRYALVKIQPQDL